MKTPAAIFVEADKPLVVDDIDLPDPGPTQVVVRHFATGVCHSQLHELHRPNPNLPAVLGHESTGVVSAVGRDVNHVKEGDHVMVTWVQRNATRATPRPTPANVTYQGKQVHFGAPAFTGTFTWSRDTVADQQMVVPLDQDVATDVTSIIGCAVMTGAGAALNAAQVRPGNSVVIIGAGGVGLSVIQACANLSAHPIIVVDVADAKLEFARKFGATVGINARAEDPVARVRELMGASQPAVSISRSTRSASARRWSRSCRWPAHASPASARAVWRSWSACHTGKRRHCRCICCSAARSIAVRRVAAVRPTATSRSWCAGSRRASCPSKRW
jgi:Zn-dependent alcohol dehydrogenase